MKTEAVTTLKRQATKLLAELRESKEPILITEHGQPSAYLLDVADYELMLTRMQILEGITRGEQAVQQGQTLDMQQAESQMNKWLE